MSAYYNNASDFASKVATKAYENPKAAGVGLAFLTAAGVNMIYKARLSQNDLWEYENFNQVNTFLRLDRVGRLLGTPTLIGNCGTLIVNYTSPGQTYLTAMNNFGMNGDRNLAFKFLVTTATKAQLKSGFNDSFVVYNFAKICEGFQAQPSLLNEACYLIGEISPLLLSLTIRDVLGYPTKLFINPTSFSGSDLNGGEFGQTPIAIFVYDVETEQTSVRKKYNVALRTINNQSGHIAYIEIDSIKGACTKEYVALDYLNALSKRRLDNVIFVYERSQEDIARGIVFKDFTSENNTEEGQNLPSVRPILSPTSPNSGATSRTFLSDSNATRAFQSFPYSGATNFQMTEPTAPPSANAGYMVHEFNNSTIRSPPPQGRLLNNFQNTVNFETTVPSLHYN